MKNKDQIESFYEDCWNAACSLNSFGQSYGEFKHLVEFAIEFEDGKIERSYDKNRNEGMAIYHIPYFNPILNKEKFLSDSDELYKYYEKIKSS